MALQQPVAAQYGGLVRHLMFQFLFGLDMRDGNSLKLRDCRLVRKVLFHRPVDIHRMRALPLDAIRVVGVHGAHDFSQALPRRFARGPLQAEGLLDHGAGGETKLVQARPRQQRLELMDLVVDLEEYRRAGGHLPILLPADGTSQFQ